MVRISAAMVLACVAGVAAGQNVNIDFNAASGQGAGAPATTFGGAAGITGAWNGVSPSSASGGTTVSVANTNGVMTGVLLKHYASSGLSQASYGTGEYSKLLADFGSATGQNGQAWAELTGLQPGVYRVWVYASLPPSLSTYVDSWGQTVPHVNYLSLSLGNQVQSYGQTGGDAPLGTFVRGKNYDVFTVQVTSSAQVVRVMSLCDNTYFAARSALNGVQVERFTGTRVYVNDTATGLGTGRDWANAMTNLHEALDLAGKSGGQITEIWVAKGTYKPGNSRTHTFKIPSGVKIYGHFNGTETTLSQRDLSSPGASSLNGNIGNVNSAADNSYRVVDATNTSSATRLDGFYILYANADGSGEYQRGGGMYGQNADLTVANCKFRYNDAAYEGGAVYLSTDSSAKFVNCEFARNTAGSFGGGIRNTSTVSIGMVNCTFQENEAGANGGAINSTGSFLVVHNSLFKGNVAANNGSGFGGAVYVFGSGADSIFRNCTFSFNRTVGGVNGTYGGIGLGSSASTSVYNSIFWSNLDGAASTTKLQEQVGGATGTSITMTDNILEGATAATGNRNHGQNPMFVDQFGPNNIAGDWDDDLRLAPGSPAIDSGNNNAMPSDQFDVDGDGNTGELLPLDILGQVRRTDDPNTVDTGIGGAPIVDRGAIEFQPAPTCDADFNGDGQVDFFDYLDFVMAFSNEDPSADFNGDGQVDFFDYLDFVSAFSAGC